MRHGSPHLPTSRDWLRALRGVGVTLVLLIVALLVFEKVWSKRALAAAVAKAEAAGLLTEPESVDAATLPPEENFTSLACFSWQYDAPERLAMDRVIEVFSKARRLSPLEQAPRAKPSMDWASAHASLASSTPQFGLTAGSAEPARDLLAGIDRFFGATLHGLETARSRPHAVLPDRSSVERNAAFSVALALTRLHCVIADVAWAAGETDRWVEALGMVRHFANTFGNDTGFIATFAQDAVLSYLLMRVEEALHEPPGRLTEAQLLAVRDFLAPDDFNDTLRRRLREEARSQREILEGLTQDPAKLGALLKETGWPSPARWLLLHSGWMEVNVASIFETHVRLSERVLDRTKPDRLSIRTHEEGMTLVRNDWLQHGYLAEMVVGGPSATVGEMASVHARQAVLHIACALEASKLRSGIYPARLEEIAKDLLPSVPMDLDGKPIRYAPVPATSRYRLWSIGRDGLDDHGTVKPSSPKHPLGFREPEGDWVWEP